jgi:3-dehydroquinate synthase
VIADATLFAWIELHSAELLDEPGGTHMTELIARAVAIKARVVEADERESGMRKTLNLGHTVGHAIEQVSGYSLLHGEAVAIGMVVETRAAEAVGIAEPGTCERLMAALERLELPTRVPSDLQPDRILAATRTDKKAREGLVAYALPCRIGEMAGAAQHYGIPLEDSVVRTALEAGRA